MRDDERALAERFVVGCRRAGVGWLVPDMRCVDHHGDRWVYLMPADDDGPAQWVYLPDCEVHAPECNTQLAVALWSGETPLMLPDFSDELTRMAVLVKAREAWGDDKAYTVDLDGYDGHQWVFSGHNQHHPHYHGEGPTELAACIAAIEAAPGKS